MADKYLYNNAGQVTEREGTVASAGAGNAGDLVALDSGGHLDPTVLPTGIGADTSLIQASEDLAAGDLVNIHNVSGAARVRKADASAVGKQADGQVLTGALTGANATVYFEGNNDQVTGLTPGRQFLSTTPGLATATAPTGSGQLVQRVGTATSATSLNFEAGEPILLA